MAERTEASSHYCTDRGFKTILKNPSHKDAWICKATWSLIQRSPLAKEDSGRKSHGCSGLNSVGRTVKHTYPCNTQTTLKLVGLLTEGEFRLIV